MKFVKILLIIGVLLIAGCATEEKEGTSSQSVVTLSEDEVTQAEGYCVLTASREIDGKFLMVSKLFEDNIPCETNDDCYNFLLEQDDYRRMAPEFEPYLYCEDRDDSIPPNQITKDGKMHP